MIPSPEEVVEKSLQILKKDKYIEGFLHSKKNSQLDCNGVDFIIIMPGGIFIPLQVKGKKEALKKHLKKHPHIKPCIVISKKERKRNNAPQIIKSKIKRILKGYLRAVQKKIAQIM